MHRRHFLQALAAAGITLPSLPGLAEADAHAGTGSGRARHLVLVELQGGNDGLNTVVPFADPLYRSLRPKLALARDEVLALDESLALHPSLEPLMRLWRRGDLGIVRGVGYPEPNRSHFRSIEIWETASDADESRVDGWLRPVTGALEPRGEHGIKALALGRDEGPLAGGLTDTVVFEDLAGFVRQARAFEDARKRAPHANAALDHVLGVERATRAAAIAFAERMDDQARAVRDKGAGLTRRLELVARLIEADVGPQVFKVELGSFDTHASQVGRHSSLLAQLGEAVAGFATRLEASGHWNDVLLMTYSEFGRRAAENASGGTDHGTAAPHFVAGGRVRGGLHGNQPDLARLEQGDPGFTTDFRSLYATVSREWFGQSLAKAPFADFETLPILSRA